MIRKLIYYGHPTLRKHCAEIAKITEEIRQLSVDLIETMHAFNGCGLAAPQIGVPLRMFISALDGRDKEGYAILGRPEVYINPKILFISHEKDVQLEGCLSIPGIFEDIARPYSITVEAMDLDGKVFQKNASGWKARNMLHENDHINGVLIIDRISKQRRRQIEPILKGIKKNYNPKKVVNA
jgi:peptide deformylase